MITNCRMTPAMNETDGIAQVPPGFVSLKSFTLQRVQDSVLASSPAIDSKKKMKDDEDSIAGAVKLRKSLRKRPWVNYCQTDYSSGGEDSDAEISGQVAPLTQLLPKGIVRGCAECGNCQQVIARWRPERSRRPILDEAPVFYPNEEEFKDTIKYIASIRPIAESYGICRIVPPSSWKPCCPLKEKHLWEGSSFSTRIQRVDRLQNRDTLKKFSRDNSIVKMKRRRLVNMKEAFGENILDGSELNEMGSYSQRFGFSQGPDFTLDSFKTYADHFKDQYFCDSLNGNNISYEQSKPSVENIEGEYWRIVEHPTEEIEVLYGADLETGVFGSGFLKETSALLDSDTVDLYAKSCWNLNNVPRLPGSLLAFESGEISGVLVPWLYVGMCFSSFCWHVEDHHLYSLNYLHWGAPKIWYGVPGREALNLESAMKKHLPDLFDEQPDLLHNLVTQFSPSILKSESVPVYRCMQNSGEFVLTFPRAYHSGFNCGFNCAEAVNIAPADWIPFGQNAVELYSEQMRKITISHDKLLLGAARESVRALWNALFLKKDSPENRVWKDASGPVGILAKSLKARVELERARREHISSSQIRKMDLAFDAENERECIQCHYDLHLSAAGCPCSPDKFSCLIHSKHLCSCEWKSKYFLFRYEISELNTLCDAVGGKLSAVHKWGLQDLKLSLSSYVNKDKAVQPKHSDQNCSEAKGTSYSKNALSTSSVLDPKTTSLKHSSSITNLSNRMLTSVSTAVMTATKLCQNMKSSVPPAKESGLKDSSISKVKVSQNPQITEACAGTSDRSSGMLLQGNKLPARKNDLLSWIVDDRKNQMMLTNSGDEKKNDVEDPDIKEPIDQGCKGESSRNCSSDSQTCSSAPVVSIIQKASDYNDCVNASITRHSFDLMEGKGVVENGTKSDSREQKQHHSETSNSDEVNKVGKINESDYFNSTRDIRELAETCSLSNFQGQNQTPKGPRMAKVVRRINCNVELLEHGTVHSGKLWSTSLAIFPKGYRSRVRYWDILNPTHMCYYVSEILDAEQLGPLFMIRMEQNPTEVFFHLSPTNCWNMVRERVNNEIRRLHILGRVNLPSFQPPGSVDGLEMFGLTFPTIIQAIEAMDKSRVCSDYWKTRPKVLNPSNCNNEGAESDKVPHAVLAEADDKLKNLIKRATSEELKALHFTLSSDQPDAKIDLLELINEQMHSRAI